MNKMKAISFAVLCGLAICLFALVRWIIPEVQAANQEYHIKSADDLIYYANELGGDAQTYEGVTLYLDEDITIPDDAGVISFGSSDAPFKGTFDGQGHTITGLNNEKGDLPDHDMGLFAWTDGAVIKNLTMKDCKVDCAYRGGILVGHAQNRTLIENVRIHGGKLKIQPANNVVSLITNVGFSGGTIAGSIDNSALYNCEVRGTEVVNNNTAGVAALGGEGLYMGGIVGSAAGGSVIEYCRVDDGMQMDDEGNRKMVESKVRNEYDVAVGALGGKAIYAGGIAGEIKDGTKIIDSYSTADVYAYCGTYVAVGAGNAAYAGGIVAEMYGGSCEVARCHYAGNIHSKQYNAILVIPIIQEDEYISGVVQYSENNTGITNSYFQRSASASDKTIYALNDEADTDNYKALTDDQYKDRSFWDEKGYDLYGTKERTTSGCGDLIGKHVNRWTMDYTRGIPIHGNSMSAAIDFPGAGSVTVGTTDLVRNSLEGESSSGEVITKDAYNFAVQGFDTYEKEIILSTDAAKIDGHENAYRFDGWYLSRDIQQDSVTQIKAEYEALTDGYDKKISKDSEYTATMEDNDLYVAHYQANLIFHDANGNVINKETGKKDGDLSDDYYNYQDRINPAEPQDAPDGEGYQFYGWTDVPSETGGYAGITTDKLDELKTGGHIYSSGDLVEKPLKLYPIYTNYLSNVITVIEGYDSEDQKNIRSGVGETAVSEKDGDVYIAATPEDGETWPDGYHFLGWYEQTDEGEMKVCGDETYTLSGVDLSKKHTYIARFEYDVEYWAKATADREDDRYYSGALYTTIRYKYEEPFDSIDGPIFYKGTVTGWSLNGFDFGYALDNSYLITEPTKVHSIISGNGSGYNESTAYLEDDFPGAVEFDDVYVGGKGDNIASTGNNRAQATAVANEGYHFLFWTWESRDGEYQNVEYTTKLDKSFSNISGQRKEYAGVAHMAAELRFHDLNGDEIRYRRYMEPVLVSEKTDHYSNGDYTFAYAEDTTVASVSSQIPSEAASYAVSDVAPEPDTPEGSQFIGWIDGTDLSDAEIAYIYGDSFDTYQCIDVDHATAYLITESDLTTSAMDLYPVYASLNVETSTNFKEEGIEANAYINIPEIPEITGIEWDNEAQAYTFTLIADTETMVLKNGDENRAYTLDHMECINPDGSVDTLQSDGNGRFSVTAEAGKQYKYVAYYNSIAVLYHLNDKEVYLSVRMTGEALGSMPDPLYKADNVGEYHEFIGWTTDAPGGQHEYYKLESYEDREGITMHTSSDRVMNYMELYPVYAPANVTVESNVDAALGGHEQDYRYLDRSHETGAFKIHADQYIESPAWTEEIEHPEESHIEYVEHPEEFHYEQKLVNQCNGCKKTFETRDEISAHMKSQMMAGHFECNSFTTFTDNVKVVDKEAWTEEIKVVDKEAWTEYIEHEAGEKQYVFTGWNRTIDGDTEENVSSNNEMLLTDVFDGAVYTAIYEEGYTITYHYWDGEKYAPLYSTGVTGNRSFIDDEGAAYDTEAFIGISNHLEAGQEFDQWQWLDDGELISWDAFAEKPIKQNMDLYPVVYKTEVRDGADEVLTQGGDDPEVYIQADKKESSVSIYFDGVYAQDKLTVEITKQSYDENGSFVGVKDIPVRVYNQYRMEEVDGELVMTGALMDEGKTNSNGIAEFEFTGTLAITKELEGSDQAFIFHITRIKDSAETTMDLTVRAGETISMSLPYGTYRVEEDEGWAWRYTPSYSNTTHAIEEAEEGLIYINSYDSAVRCTNSETNDRWIGSDADVENVFRSSEQKG